MYKTIAIQVETRIKKIKITFNFEKLRKIFILLFNVCKNHQPY